MNIRPATETDIPQLSKLATETWLAAFGHRYSEEEPGKSIEEQRGEKYFADALQKLEILLAEENGALIGYAQFGHVVLTIPNVQKEDMELWRLYVHPDHQRKGIGKALLEAALAHPIMQSAPNIYLDVWEENKDAIRLYESYGFVKTGQIVDGDIIMVRNKL